MFLQLCYHFESPYTIELFIENIGLGHFALLKHLLDTFDDLDQNFDILAASDGQFFSINFE